MKRAIHQKRKRYKLITGPQYVISMYRDIIKKQIEDDKFVEGGPIERRYNELVLKTLNIQHHTD